MEAENRMCPLRWNYTVFASAETIDTFFSSDKSLRTTDLFTRKALLLIRRLFQDGYGSLDKNRTGVVLSTDIGPRESLRDTAQLLRSGDYRQINPSFFPNVMASTALSALTKELGIHGPAGSFVEADKSGADAKLYAAVQMDAGRCDSMIYIRIDSGGWGEGKWYIPSRIKKMVHE